MLGVPERDETVLLKLLSGAYRARPWHVPSDKRLELVCEAIDILLVRAPSPLPADIDHARVLCVLGAVCLICLRLRARRLMLLEMPRAPVAAVAER